MNSYRRVAALILLSMALVACGATQVPTETPAAVPDPGNEGVVDLASMASEDTITRAEMAVILLSEEHGPEYRPVSASGGFFNDVAGHWAEAWIEQLVTEGIGSGNPDGSFRPDEAVTRAEAAVFLLKLKHGSDHAPPQITGSSFTDVAGHWAEAWIEQLKVEGLTAGFADGTYRPGASLTAGDLRPMLQGISAD